MAKKKVRRFYEKQASGAGRSGGAKDTKYNPFEYKHSSRRFDVLGDKPQAGSKKKPQKKAQKTDEGIRRRAKTLLVEYQRRGRNNAFMDRRFGEGDDTIGEEDKAILRYQKERIRQAKANRFALDDGDGIDDYDNDVLTHQGRSLDDATDFGGGPGSDDDDDLFQPKRDVGGYDRLLTEFQFGNDGGADGAGGDGGEGGAGGAERKRSKKEVMQEIIAKSKHFKAVKAKEKDEDETLRNKLDTAFRDMITDGAVFGHMKRKRDAMESDGRRAPTGDVLYDRAADEVVFDLKSAGARALPTQAEVARKAKQQLEQLEAERRRLSAEGEGPEGSGGDALLGAEEREVGGFKGRRLRQKLAEEEPLGGARRGAAARAETGDDLGDDFDLDASDSGSDGYSESYSESESGRDEDEEEEEGSSGKDDASSDDKSGEGSEGESGGETSEDEGPSTPPPAKRHASAAKPAPPLGGSPVVGTLPFVIPAPQTYDEFAGLMEGLDGAQRAVALERIRQSNAIVLGPENRRKMQVYFGILVQHFFNQAKPRPMQVAEMNECAAEIHALANQITLYAATVARARLDQVQRCCAKGRWPTNAMLATLRLWIALFAVDGARHPVLDPMGLLLGKTLTYVPVRTRADALRGLYLCHLCSLIAKVSNAFVPEALQFVTALLTQCAAPGSDLGPPRPLSPSGKEGKDASPDTSLAADFDAVLAGLPAPDAEGSEEARTPPLGLDVLELAVGLAETFVGLHGDLPAAPELLSPLVRGSRAAYDRAAPLLPPASREALLGVVVAQEGALSAADRTRKGLGSIFRVPVKAAKQFNPRFEDDYVNSKDYDVDRARAERKRLQRELKRESRGAVRELRKDNRYLAGVRGTEQRQQKAETKSKYNRMFQFLRDQDRDMKSGGQGGMVKLKRKRG